MKTSLKMRRAVLLELQWLTTMQAVSAEEAQALATAMERVSSPRFPGEVGPGSVLPEGSRVLDGRSSKGNVQGQHKRLVAFVRTCGADDTLQVLLRPQSSIATSLADEMGKALLNDSAPLQQICEAWKWGVLTKEETLDRLLLILWDAIFAKQSHEWTQRGLANLPVADVMNLGHWFLRGQKVGQKPLFDGICAMCGELLYGDVNQSLGNKTCGPAMNRDGEQVPWTATQTDLADDVASDFSTVLDRAGAELCSPYIALH